MTGGKLYHKRSIILRKRLLRGTFLCNNTYKKRCYQIVTPMLHEY
jgi:hypothetical protein